MSLLPARVRAFIGRHGLIGPGDRVVLAFSGGADSVALGLVLEELAGRGGWTFAGVAHVHHGLRGEAADADEAFCRDLAAARGWPIEVRRADVAARARAERRSVESAARDARYACLRDAAASLGGTRLATAHTLDDQAETVLLRLVRGAGPRGLAGIRVRRGDIIRPMLDCRRRDVRSYLEARGVTWREDASNDDRAIPRNRVRHELLPLIDRLTPGGRAALARSAALSADLEAFLDTAVIEMAPNVVLSDGRRGARVLDATALGRLPAALARHIVARAAGDVAPGASLGMRHLDAILRLAGAEKEKGHLDVPGMAVERAGGELRLAAAGAAVEADGADFDYALPVPGQVAVREAGMTILARTSAAAPAAVGDGVTRATVQASAVSPPFSVRNRRAGDRLRPLGAPGRRKVQDLFVDRKIPRVARDRVPIVVDAEGRIVWIVGVTVADECRVTAPEAGVVVLETQ